MTRIDHTCSCRACSGTIVVATLQSDQHCTLFQADFRLHFLGCGSAYGARDSLALRTQHTYICILACRRVCVRCVLCIHGLSQLTRAANVLCGVWRFVHTDLITVAVFHTNLGWSRPRVPFMRAHCRINACVNKCDIHSACVCVCMPITCEMRVVARDTNSHSFLCDERR